MPRSRPIFTKKQHAQLAKYLKNASRYCDPAGYVNYAALCNIVAGHLWQDNGSFNKPAFMQAAALLSGEDGTLEPSKPRRSRTADCDGSQHARQPVKSRAPSPSRRSRTQSVLA